MYSNPLPLSSHDLPRMLYGASGEDRAQWMGCWGDPAQPGASGALTELENSYPIVIA